jgi:hypothetical protein
MSFGDWAGITSIMKEKWKSLSINFDNHEDEMGVHPVFLYTTYAEDGSVHDHDHIELDEIARKELLQWLIEFDGLTQEELVVRTKEPKR